ncbi:DUF2291 domain-containing protein, partial [Klebsiella pneumoniae]
MRPCGGAEESIMFKKTCLTLAVLALGGCR